MAVTTADGVVVAFDQQPSTQSHIDWGAVIAGAVMAAAISLALMTFGSAPGLSFVSPQEGAEPPGIGFIILTALWTVIVTVASFSIGGYMAGRMRRRAFDSSPHEVTVRDATHGLTVWAVGVLIGGMLAASVAAGGRSTRPLDGRGEGARRHRRRAQVCCPCRVPDRCIVARRRGRCLHGRPHGWPSP